MLAWAQTQIFEVYYFRMYVALVVLAAAHALVLLPVLLTLAGPPPLPLHRASDDNLSLQVLPPARMHLCDRTHNPLTCHPCLIKHELHTPRVMLTIHRPSEACNCDEFWVVAGMQEEFGD